jgi:hypothetical protein
LGGSSNGETLRRNFGGEEQQARPAVREGAGPTTRIIIIVNHARDVL